MKTSMTWILASLLLPALAGAAVTEKYEVVLRKKNGGYRIDTAELTGLKAPGRFETDEFKVVWKKEDEALTLRRIDEVVELRAGAEKSNPYWVDRTADEIRMMAATALYHAGIARAYWRDRLGSDYVKSMEQVVIRLDLTSAPVKFAHYANDAYEPQYNNAVSIPPGKPFKTDSGEKPWGNEIWFRPRKEIPISEILRQLPEDPSNATIREARQALYPMQLDQGLREVIYATFQGRLDNPATINNITRQGGTLLLLEGAFQVAKVINRVIIPQHFYIDAAFVPEIVYHEFSHLALGETLVPNISTPVNEGMADYFAAMISGDPREGKKIKQFSTAVGKNGKKRKQFEIEYESLGKAQSDFVLALLWGLRDVVGPEVTDQVVYEMRKELNTRDSDIRTGLVGGILYTCDRVCKSPFRDHLLVSDYLQRQGL
jgi:hypothetical protein